MRISSPRIKIICLILSLSIILSLMPNFPQMAYATVTQRTTSLDLTESAVTWNGGSGNPIRQDLDASDTEGWSWAYATKTLTLSGINLVASDSYYALRVPSDTTITITGPLNTISNAYSTSNCYGIYCGGSYTINGTGTLDVTADASTDFFSSGMYTYRGTITINGGTVNTAGFDWGMSFGPLATLIVSGGTLNAIGYSSDYSIGITLPTIISGTGVVTAKGSYRAFMNEVTANDSFFTGNTDYDGISGVEYTSISNINRCKYAHIGPPAIVTSTAIVGVTAPVTGATPVTAITECAQYTGSVTWNGNPTNFLSDTVYTATVKLTAKAGFTFTGVNANSFTLDNADVTHDAGSGNTLTVTIVFPITKTPQTISYADSNIAKTYGDISFTNSLTLTTVNGTITYASDDTSVATVNTATGEVTIIAVGDGSATITATAEETDTHAETTASYTVIVAKKALTLKADDKSMMKGNGLPTFTYTTTGLVGSDAVTTSPTIASTTDGAAVGTFDITIEGGVITNATNYDITYTKGKLTVVEPLFTATITNGTGGGSYAEGSTVTITANDRSGYTFTGWSGMDVTFADKTAKTTTFTMPAKAVTVTANYYQNNSGGAPTPDRPNPPTQEIIKVPGIVEKAQQQNNGAPAVSINNNGDELKVSVLTPEEQVMVAKGENAQVILKVTDIGTSVSDKEKELIHEKLAAENGVSENAAADIPVLYVDLSLYKLVGSQEQAKVTVTNGKISISLEVPERFCNTDVTKSRTFYIIRIHNGEATRIEGSYDAVTHLFTFETDRFSTYALTYQDTTRIQTYQDFHHLQLTAKANKTSQTLSYKKADNVDGYLIYGGKCGAEMTKLAEVPADTTSYTVKGLKQGTYYKYQVKAYRIIDGEQVVIMTSKVIHSITESKNYANPTKVTSSAASVKLAAGKSKTVTAQVVLPKDKKQKEHVVTIRYESSNKEIATVNSKGKITAKAKGTCYVYAYAQNGVFKKIKVTVK